MHANTISIASALSLVVLNPGLTPSTFRLSTVLKSLLLLACIAIATPTLAAPDFPELTGRVVDRANILDDAAEAALTAQLEAHETATSNQLVVVTVPGLQGYDISDFTNQLGRHWGIGQADKDNGVLLLVAPDERKVRIEVGYGLEGALTDAVSSDIIRRQILPQFREGEYSTGIEKGATSIISAIGGEYTLEPASASRGQDDPLKSYFPLIFLALIVVFEVLKRFGLRQLGNTAFPTAIFGIAVTAISGSIVVGIIAAIVVFLLIYFFGKSGRGGGTRGGVLPYDRDNDYTSGSSGGGGFSGGGGSFGGGGASGGW